MAQIPPHELSRLQSIADETQTLEDLVARRVNGEPLQYIEGTAAFGPIELAIDPRVLVPRPETESLLDIAQRMVRNPSTVVDLCTGSGALALALKHSFPAAAVFAIDISDDALAVARENRERTGLDVFIAQGDLFEPLPGELKGAVDLIVANPPYVAESEYRSLPVDVQREPKVALVAGPTGLEVIQEIGASASDWLRPGGVVICEIGEKQGVSAASSFTGLPAVVRKDLNGRDRYVVAVKP